MVVYEDYIIEVVCEDVGFYLGILYSSYSNWYGILLCSGDVLVQVCLFRIWILFLGFYTHDPTMFLPTCPLESNVDGVKEPFVYICNPKG